MHRFLKCKDPFDMRVNGLTGAKGQGLMSQV